MTQLYRITPKNGGTIKSVLKLKENFANPLTEGEKRSMSVITVYSSGCAYRSIDDPVYTEDLDKYIVCNSELGSPTLTNASSEQEFEFGYGMDGTYADETRNMFTDRWINGGDGLTGLEYFTSDKMDSPSWTVDSTEIRITGPITIDKVDGDQYTNIVEGDVQPVSKYAGETAPEAPKFGLDFRL
jgi:hypothetical protein